MGIGDQVIAEYVTGVQTPGVNEPPLRGAVSAENAGAITVLWQNAELTVWLDSQLRQLVGMPEEVRALIGKYVQLTAWPAAGVGEPKSPGASGLVVDAVAHGPFDSGVADRVDLTIATENGAQYLTLSDVFDFNTFELRPGLPIRIESGRREV